MKPSEKTLEEVINQLTDEYIERLSNLADEPYI